MKILLLSAFSFVLSFNAFSASSFFDIDTDNISYTGSWSAPERTALQTLLLQLESEGQAQLSNIEPGDYLKNSANATIMAGKSVGSDYANNPDLFLVGAAVGIGISTEGQSLTDVTDSNEDIEDIVNGIGAQVSLLGGVNLGRLPFVPKKIAFFDMNRFHLFVNFFKYDIEKNDFSADALSLGFMLRYQVLESRAFFPFSMLYWEGLHVHLGMQKGNLDLEVNETLTLTESDSTSVPGLTMTGTFNSIAGAKVEVDTLSIPLEISSAIRFLYLMTLYGGLGADLNTGTGSGQGSLSNSTVTVSTNLSKSASTTASASLGEEQKVDSFFSRAFVGLQFNLWKIKLGIQYDKALGDDLYGLGAHLKFVW
ncbi:MAG: hypothetical protein H6621_01975 [Halobacteriovoraceae bacterium]|nr:hypothetical protein [Halobacteriovoraceae bacterium]MCB9093810.1 hypothetical protein [Halobacteriovoraceae bacterium]